MRKTNSFFSLVILMLSAAGAARAQSAVRWEPNLEVAQQRAAQTGRLVLVHFWADWCGPCKVMDREVFARHDVASAMDADYVCVKINTDFRPATARQFGIISQPTDVIVSPQGQQIARFTGGAPPAEYIARLRQVAQDVSRGNAGQYAQHPQAPPPAMAESRQPLDIPQRRDERFVLNNYDRRQPTAAPVHPGYNDNRQPLYRNDHQLPPPADAPPQGGFQAGPAPAPQQSLPPMQPQFQPQLPPAATPTQPFQARTVPEAEPAGNPSGNPPLGLEGYCPVQLSDDMNSGHISPDARKWTMGNRQWGVAHRGRSYLFANPENMRRFWDDPDRYAPVLSGNDAVMVVDQGQAVEGRRAYGAFFGGRIYLFANEANLAKFERSPNRYADYALQAMRPGRMNERLSAVPRGEPPRDGRIQ